MAKKDENSKANQVGGILFVGSIIIGTAVGLAVDNVAVGSMLGVGGGFVLMALTRLVVKD